MGIPKETGKFQAFDRKVVKFQSDLGILNTHTQSLRAELSNKRANDIFLNAAYYARNLQKGHVTAIINGDVSAPEYSCEIKSDESRPIGILLDEPSTTEDLPISAEFGAFRPAEPNESFHPNHAAALPDGTVSIPVRRYGRSKKP